MPLHQVSVQGKDTLAGRLGSGRTLMVPMDTRARLRPPTRWSTLWINCTAVKPHAYAEASTVERSRAGV